MKWILISMILLASILAMFPGLFRGGFIFPADLFFFYEPWKTEFHSPFVKPSNWILFDEILEFYPWREHLSKSLINGTIPFWDPTAFCGYPFIAAYQTGFMYPPDRMMDGLPFPSYCNLRVVIHLFLAGLGAAVYFSRRRLTLNAVLIGAVSFELCGFLIAWLGHPHLKTAVWLPWYLLAIDLCLEKTRNCFLMVGSVAFLIMSSGHIETALHVFSAGMVYFLIRFLTDPAVQSRRWKAVTRYVSGTIAGILLSSGVLLPFAEYLVRSVAYDVRSEGVVVQPYLDKILLLAQWLPDLFGSTPGGTYYYPGFHSGEINGGYVGTICAVLALAAVFWKPRVSFHQAHAVLALWCMGVAYRFPVVYQLTEYIPGYRMSYNFRLLLPMAFSLIALAVSILDSLFKRDKKAIRVASIATGVFIVLTSMIPFIILDLPISNRIQVDRAIADPVLAGLGGLLILLIGLQILHRTTVHYIYIGVLWLGLTCFELIRWGSDYNPVMPPALLDNTPASTEILRVGPDDEPFRVLPLGYTYPPHTCLLYAFHDIRGNDALTPKNVEDYVAIVQPDIRAETMLPAMRMLRLENPYSKLLDALNVKYIVSPLDRKGPEIYTSVSSIRSGGVRIDLNTGYLPRAFEVNRCLISNNDQETLDLLADPAFDPATMAIVRDTGFSGEGFETGVVSTSRITHYSRHRIDIESEGGHRRLLVLSDTHYPGWKARVDGREVPIIQTNHMMRGIILENGSHQISLSYHPVSFKLGVFISLISMIGFITIFLSGLTKKSHPDENLITG